MNNRQFTAVVISGSMMFAFLAILICSNSVVNVIAQNTEPVLDNPAVYLYEEDGQMIVEFAVNYQDIDGDEGTVELLKDDDAPVIMLTTDQSPSEGQYHLYTYPAELVDDNTEFRFSANDNNGSLISLPPEEEDPFQVGNFLGWGEPPVLSNPDVKFDGDDWIFNVTYWDPDGDEAIWVEVVIDDLVYHSMETIDPDPSAGQNYITRILEEEVDEFTEFYFEAEDAGGSYTDIRDEGYTMFEVRDFDYLDIGSNGDENGNGNGNGGTIGAGWFDNPEVVVGIIGLAILGAGSAYGVYRKKKKHGKFSNLLTQLDDVYGSFKLNPKRCETELEKMRAMINDELKKGTIDENNYTILKTRIDEIMSEIRGESMKTQLSELPKDIELKIKDMLIDGEITRQEYDKLLPIIKGSDMTVDDKEKMKKMVEGWVKEDESD